MDEHRYDPYKAEREENPYSDYYGTGVPKRNRKQGHGLLIFGLIVLTLALLCGSFLKKYSVLIERSGEGICVTVEEREKARLRAEEENRTVAETASLPEEQPEEPIPEKPPVVGLGSGAKLSISSRRIGVQTAVTDEDGALSFQDIYRKAIPSVVSVVIRTAAGTGSGTGIVMTKDGYIITNQHVVENAAAITVVLQNGDECAASLVGADSVSDLAVLKIDAVGLTEAEFGDSGLTQVGDTVVAIGDPLGLELRGTMTDGIISAINRDIITNGRTMTLLQTNAQLNNGNSGGPLINCYGQVIGVNTMKMGSYSSNTVEGIGFAIPIATAKPIIDELIEKGYVSGRPAIGIQGDSVPAYVRLYYRLPDGVYVAYVYPNSDAAAKGLAEGDVITEIDGIPISTMEQLSVIKNRYTAGDTVKLKVYRNGQYLELEIVLMDQNDAD